MGAGCDPCLAGEGDTRKEMIPISCAERRRQPPCLLCGEGGDPQKPCSGKEGRCLGEVISSGLLS